MMMQILILMLMMLMLLLLLLLMVMMKKKMMMRRKRALQLERCCVLPMARARSYLAQSWPRKRKKKTGTTMMMRRTKTMTPSSLLRYFALMQAAGPLRLLPKLAPQCWCGRKPW